MVPKGLMAPVAQISPAWCSAGAAPPPVGLGGLVASPALHPSTSGGELSFSLGPAPLRMEGASSESEEGGAPTSCSLLLGL